MFFNLPNNLDDISKIIQKYDVISFDIYDTLICRRFLKPRDVFKFIELNENVKYFYKTRVWAERIARHLLMKKKGEITLNDIYKYMPPKMKYLKDIEIKYEKKYICKQIKNYDIYKCALDQKKKIIFVSDMYLPIQVIEDILENTGYQKYDKLYISGEIGKTKLKGTLYQHILNDLNINPETILHFGDSTVSDIEKAAEYNINTCLVNRYTDIFLEKEENRKFKEFLKVENNSIYASIIVSLFAYRAMTNLYNLEDNERIGYLVGGITAFSYLQFLTSIAEKDDTILFIARDGYLLQKLYNKIYKNPLKNHYLFAQRKLYYSMEFFSLYSLRLFAKEFNLKMNKYIAFLYPYNFVKKYKKQIGKWLYENKKEYKRYIRGMGISSNSFISVDMITKNYTSQLCITKLFKHSNIKGVFFGSSTNKKYKNSYIFINKNLLFKEKLIYYIIEHLFTSDTPPILRIKEGKPIYDSNFSVEASNKIKSIENGILKFADDIMAQFNDLKIPASVVNNYIYSYVYYPNEKDITYYKKTYIDDGNIYNNINSVLYDKIKTYFKK